MCNLIKKSDKGFKTTIIALVSLALILVNLILLSLRIITGSEFRDIIIGIGTTATVILGLFTKDSDKTSTNEIDANNNS